MRWLISCIFSLFFGLIPVISVFSQLPNIVYILADDMGYGDVSTLNSDGKIHTNHIDQVAEQGMTFIDAHTNSSVCTPTRYGILTGRYSWRTKLKNGVLSGNSEHLIDLERLTVAKLLQNSGYSTAVVGKWHLGMDWKTNDGEPPDRRNGSNVNYHLPADNGPLQLGFDYYFGIAGSLNMTPHAYVENQLVKAPLEFLEDNDAMKSQGLKGIPGWWGEDYNQDQVLGMLGDKSLAWMKNHLSNKGDAPFFLYLPLSAPHAPIVPSPEFKEKSGIGSYGDYCLEVDHIVGRIMHFLDEHQISDNTLLIFTADNGCSPQAHIGELQTQEHFPSYIFRGLKGSLYEGGHRVPFIVKWPAEIEPKSISSITICTTDLLATVADLMGKDLPKDAGEDSFSFLPAFHGNSPEWTESRGVVHHSDAGHFAIRKGKWKLIFDKKGGSRRVNPKSVPVINQADIQLFDMEKDPSETTNVQHLHPGIVEEMTSLMINYIESGRSRNPGKESYEDFKKWTQLDNIYKTKQ